MGLKRWVILLQNKPKRKERGIADIVFCIDASFSMKSCIEGVKNNIMEFVQGLQETPNRTIDYRIAILAHDWKVFRILDFTEDIDRFSNALDKVVPKWEEFTLPAIDWSLDFNWREKCHKFIIIFTDEKLEHNHDPDFQKSKFKELIEKIKKLYIPLWIIAPECEEYKYLSQTRKSEYIKINRKNYVNIDFRELLHQIGATISSTTGDLQESEPVKKDI